MVDKSLLLEYFPYSKPRPHQEEIIAFLVDSISKGKNVVLEAPTGSGKTVNVLSALFLLREKAIACCRTHEQADRFIEEARRIRSIKKVYGVSIRGKKEMCLVDKMKEAGDYEEATILCRKLRERGLCKYELYIDDEIARRIIDEPIRSLEIKELGRKKRFCPYYAQFDLLEEVASRERSVIAIPYIYMTKRELRTRFVQALGGDLADFVIVFDEAHNLLYLPLSHNSVSISLSTFENAIREADEYLGILARRRLRSKLVDLLSGARKLLEEREIREKLETNGETLVEKEVFLEVLLESLGSEENLRNLVDALIIAGEHVRETRAELGKRPRSSLYSLGRFLRSFLDSLEDQSIVMIASIGVSPDNPRLELIPIDPSKILSDILSEVRSVHMSGTLSPLESYAEVIGLKNYIVKSFPAFYKEENVLALVDMTISSKFTLRIDYTYRRYIEKISRISSIVPGNIGVFCPSYEFLEKLLDLGLEERVSKPLFVEKKGMSSEEESSLIEEFKSRADKGGAVLLAVARGRASEGADFPGLEMQVAVIAGVPYPPPTDTIRYVIRYFESKFPGRIDWRSKGEYLAYWLPAHRAMVQAAGRAHRSPEDKAAITFLDERVSRSYVLRDIPPWIRRRMVRVYSTRELEARLARFFGLEHQV